MSAGACSHTGKVAGVSIESLVCPFCPVGYRVPLGWPSIHDVLSEAGLAMRVCDSWTADLRPDRRRAASTAMTLPHARRKTSRASPVSDLRRLELVGAWAGLGIAAVPS